MGWREMLTNAAVEEAAFQWTGVRLEYAKLDARFVARIRQIVEPLVPHIAGEFTKGVARGNE